MRLRIKKSIAVAAACLCLTQSAIATNEQPSIQEQLQNANSELESLTEQILPGELENTRRVIDWVAANFRPGDVLFSLMTPQPGAVGNLARHVTKAEYRAAAEYMENCGITDGFTQERTSAKEEYTPDFDLRGI